MGRTQFKNVAGQILVVESQSNALGNFQQIGIGRGKLLGLAIPSVLAKHPSIVTQSKSERGKKPRVAKHTDPKEPLQFLEGASFFSVGNALIHEIGGSVGKLGISRPPLIKKRHIKVAEPPRKPKKIGSSSVDIVQQSKKKDIKAKVDFEKKTMYK